MEDQLRLFLLLGGTVFIIAVLAHGIWKIRKNGKPSEKERLEPRQWKDTDENDGDVESQEGFDELGIGAVRIVGASQNANEGAPDTNADREGLDEEVGSNLVGDGTRIPQSGASAAHTADNIGESSVKVPSSDDEDERTNSNKKASQPTEPKLYGSVVSNPKPHMKGHSRSVDTASGSGNSIDAAFPEPPGFLLREGADEEVSTPSQEETLAVRDQNQVQSGQVSKTSGNEYQHRQDNAASSAKHYDANAEITGEEPKRPAQKFYIDPTFEENSGESQPLAKDEREVADFSLDAPKEPFASNEPSDENEQPRRFSRGKRSKTPIRRREEPNFGDDQMRIDFDTSDANVAGYEEESFSANGTEKVGSKQEKSSNMDPEVLVLNVRTPEGEPISGAALLPMLLTLGFKFGDQDIFHRHVNSNGKGPVLFSLANMFKPGVFDIDNLETFETQGVSLFMILPIEGDPHQVFNMMHNAARKLADEFGAQVLDGRRSVLTKQGLQQYVEKIREFERKRMISRN